MSNRAKPGKIHTQIFEEQNRFLEDLYSLLEVGREQSMSVASMAETTGAKPNTVITVTKCLRNANAFITRYEYHGGGKVSFWTLLVPKEKAQIILNKYQMNLVKTIFQHRSQAMRNRGNGIVYTSGPDMPKGIGIKSFSPVEKQPKALVEAARQFGTKISAARNAMETLKAAGITVDEKTFFSSMGIPTDDRLEAVSLVLPYIDDLLSTIRDLKTARREEAANTATPVTI